MSAFLRYFVNYVSVMKDMRRNKQISPHELGIILEYPVEDVEDFIKFGGQNCLMERYWKVYHNVERARAVFAAYDAAKDQAMGEVIAGYPLHLVAVS